MAALHVRIIWHLCSRQWLQNISSLPQFKPGQSSRTTELGCVRCCEFREFEKLPKTVSLLVVGANGDVLRKLAHKLNERTEHLARWECGPSWTSSSLEKRTQSLMHSSSQRPRMVIGATVIASVFHVGDGMMLVH